MKIVRFVYRGEASYGLLEGEDVYLLEHPGDIFGELRPGVKLANIGEVELLSPCQPTKIVAVGLNYADHAAEANVEVPTTPLIFLKPPSAVIGSGQPIVYPPFTKRLEYEGELAVVMGRQAQRVKAAEALDYVLGYTCANDVTARDLQRQDSQWSRAKGSDTFAPLGPWVVTDLNVGHLAITTRLNGQIKQHSSTSSMVSGVSQIIEFISTFMTLEPGDVIITGTPAGVGPMQPGDTVEVEIEGIGVLKNRVVSSH
ncbi:MAG: fumarylacetoacetate hydrolase family protein [Anaerolineae bacterium]